jgi:hypothetical protein
MPLFGPFARPGGLFGRTFYTGDADRPDPDELAAYRDFLRRAGGPAAPDAPPSPAPGGVPPRYVGDAPPAPPDSPTGNTPPAFPLLDAQTTQKRQLFGPLANLPPLR